MEPWLEDRPIFIFDEWAANQDPSFKHVFYHTLLPELRAAGKTLLVISHDENHFDIAIASFAFRTDACSKRTLPSGICAASNLKG